MTVSIQWLGHSAFSLVAGDKFLLLDPFLTHNPLSPVKPDSVNADVILLSHAHSDHVGDANGETAHDTIAVAKRTQATLFCNAEMAGWFGSKGLQRIVAGNSGGVYRNEWMSVRWTQAIHSSTFGDGSAGGNPNGYVLELAGMRLYYAGDTALFSDMTLIGNRGIDIAFLPIGDLFTMGVEDSVEAVKLVRPRFVIPMHYNTFAPIVQDVVHWAALINRETNAQPVVLDPGQHQALG